MNVLLAFAVLCILVLLALLKHEISAQRRLLVEDFRVLRSSLGEIAGKQIGLESEYREVHKILQGIRDLNQAELQERKEILQQTNLTASNRVLQMRSYMADLEEAARKELEGLRNG